MKILLTTSFFPPFHIGGDAVHVKYLAEALVKQGHEVHVLHSIDAYNLKKKEKKRFEKSKIKIHSLRSPLGKLEPVLNYLVGTQKHTMNAFKRLVQEEKFDVVHHHNISLLGYNILKKIGPYKNLYTAHDYWLVCHKYDMMKDSKECKSKTCFSCCIKHKKPYQFFRNTKKFKRCLSDLDKIIAPSKYMGDILSKEFKNVTVLNNFIPDEKKKKNKKVKDYFVFAGVLERCKGILNLVKVFSKIDKRLLVIGAGSLESEIKKIKTKNIEVLGWKDKKELFPLIESAQALIMPSIWPENNPLIALESMILGTPVIGSNWGGIPEIVEKIDEKLIFKGSDKNQLKKIIQDFNRKKYPSTRIKKIYEKYFSQKRFLEKYYRLIR